MNQTHVSNIWRLPLAGGQGITKCVSKILMVHGWWYYQHSMGWMKKGFFKRNAANVAKIKISSTQYRTFTINTKPYRVTYKGFHYLVSAYISTFILFFFFFFPHIPYSSHNGLLPCSKSLSSLLLYNMFIMLRNTHPPKTFSGSLQVLFPQVQPLCMAFLLLGLLRVTILCASE